MNKNEKMLQEFKDALEMFKDSDGMCLVDFDLLFKKYPHVYKWFKGEKK